MADTTAKEKEKDKLDPQLMGLALIMLAGIFAPVLDATVVNIAIKSIGEDLNCSLSVIQWLATAYILAMGIAVPLSGWLANRFSGKTVYLAALALFGAGSVLAIASPGIEMLIVSRVIQGLAAGIVLPVMQTVLIRAAGTAKLLSLMAFLSLPTAIIPILGPTVGGMLVGFGWQWIFAINIPFVVAGLLLGFVKLPKMEAVNKEQKLDFIGLLLLSPGFCALIFGISYIKTAGKFEFAMGLLITGLALFATYTAYALKSKKEPLLDVRLFKLRNFSVSVILIFVFGMLSTGTLFVLPLYFQHLHEMTPFIAGLILAPQGIGMLLTRTQAAKFSEKVGEKAVILAGIGGTLLGTVPFMFVQTTSYIPLLMLLLIRGAGLGILMVPAMSVIYAGLDPKGVAQATTSTRIFQQIGGAFGTALLAILLTHSMANSGTGNAFFTPFLWSSLFTLALAVPALLLESKKQAE